MSQQSLTFQEEPTCGKMLKCFGRCHLCCVFTNEKNNEEVVHYDMEDATESQAVLLYKVFVKIQQWMSWE
jgi:hypothetical protein